MSNAMAEEQARALGERWIAAGGGYKDGMIVFFRQDDETPWPERVDADWIPGREADGILAVGPDLRDPATRGAALAVVRERWGDPGMFARRSTSRGLWRVSGSDTRSVVEAETEAEALVAALEAAPGAGS